MKKRLRKLETERKKRIKFGERLTFLLPKLPFFVSSHTETTSWHFQLSNENNMFVWEKNKPLDSRCSTVNSGLVVTKAGPVGTHYIVQHLLGFLFSSFTNYNPASFSLQHGTCVNHVVSPH